MYERHRFWKRVQKEGEPFDRWVKDLRMIAKDCEYAEEDNMIRDNIVFSVWDKKVQERMLRKSDLTLKDAMEYCRAAESSQSQLAEIRRDDVAGINEMRNGADGRQCFHCGESGHISPNCPNKEKQFKCYNCNEVGHKSFDCPQGDGYPQRKKKNAQRGRGRAVEEQGGAGSFQVERSMRWRGLLLRNMHKSFLHCH